MQHLSHFTPEHMHHAAEEMADLARRFPHLKPAAERMHWRARAMAQGTTLHDLAASGDAVARALVGKEAA